MPTSAVFSAVAGNVLAYATPAVVPSQGATSTLPTLKTDAGKVPTLTSVAFNISVISTDAQDSWVANFSVTQPMSGLYVSEEGYVAVALPANSALVYGRNGPEYDFLAKLTPPSTVDGGSVNGVAKSITAVVLSSGACHAALVLSPSAPSSSPPDVHVFRLPSQTLAPAGSDGVAEGLETTTSANFKFTAKPPGPSARTLATVQQQQSRTVLTVMPQCHFVGSSQRVTDEDAAIRDHTLVVAWAGTAVLSTYALVNAAGHFDVAAALAMDAKSKASLQAATTESAAGSGKAPAAAATASKTTGNANTAALPGFIGGASLLSGVAPNVPVDPTFNGQRHRVLPHYISTSALNAGRQVVAHRRGAFDSVDGARVAVGCADGIIVVWSAQLRHFTHLFNDAPHRTEQHSVRPLVVTALSFAAPVVGIPETTSPPSRGGVTPPGAASLAVSDLLVASLVMGNPTATDHSRIVIYDLQNNSKVASLNYVLNLQWAVVARRVPLLAFATLSEQATTRSAGQPAGTSSPCLSIYIAELTFHADVTPLAKGVQSATPAKSTSGAGELQPFAFAELPLPAAPGFGGYAVSNTSVDPVALFARCDSIRSSVAAQADSIFVTATTAGDGGVPKSLEIRPCAAVCARWPSMRRCVAGSDMLSAMLTRVAPAKRTEDVVAIEVNNYGRQPSRATSQGVAGGSSGTSPGNAPLQATATSGGLAALGRAGSLHMGGSKVQSTELIRKGSTASSNRSRERSDRGATTQPNGGLRSKAVSAAVQLRDASKGVRQKRVAELFARLSQSPS